MGETAYNRAYLATVLRPHPNSVFGGTSFMLETLYAIVERFKDAEPFELKEV